MKNIWFRSFLMVCIFCIIGVVHAQEKPIDSDLRYHDDDCVDSIAGLTLTIFESDEFKDKEGALLRCTYSITDKFSSISSKVQIKYDIVNTGKMEIRTFMDEFQAKEAFNLLKNHLKNEKYEIGSKSATRFVAKGNFYTEEDGVYPHKDFRVIELVGVSLISGSYDVYFFPTRFYPLNPSMSQEKAGGIVQKYGKNIPFVDENKVLSFLGEAIKISSMKHKETDSRGIIQQDYERWSTEHDTLVEVLDKKKNLWSWLGCLVADGINLNFDYLTKIGISDPHMTCAYILYKEVGEAKRINYEKPSINTFVDNYGSLKSFCINDRVKAEYKTKVLDWKQRILDYELDHVVICKKHCLMNEDEIICE